MKNTKIIGGILVFIGSIGLSAIYGFKKGLHIGENHGYVQGTIDTTKTILETMNESSKEKLK